MKSLIEHLKVNQWPSENVESREWKVLPKYKSYVEDNDISKRWS